MKRYNRILAFLIFAMILVLITSISTDISRRPHVETNLNITSEQSITGTHFGIGEGDYVLITDTTGYLGPDVSDKPYINFEMCTATGWWSGIAREDGTSTPICGEVITIASFKTLADSVVYTEFTQYPWGPSNKNDYDARLGGSTGSTVYNRSLSNAAEFRISSVTDISYTVISKNDLTKFVEGYETWKSNPNHKTVTDSRIHWLTVILPEFVILALFVITPNLVNRLNYNRRLEAINRQRKDSYVRNPAITKSYIPMSTNSEEINLMKKEESLGNSWCEICYKEINTNSSYVNCSSCHNDYHRDCIKILLPNSKICPICKSSLLPRKHNTTL